MAERTLTVSSAGKTFAFTGWKVGWVERTGPAGGRGAHRQAVPHLRQRGALPAGGGGRSGPAGRVLRGAAAGACEPGGTDFARGLAAAGFEVFEPHATYFAVTGVAGFGVTDGMSFCRDPTGTLWSGRRAGWQRSTTIPASPGHWCALPSASSRMSSTRPCAGWAGSAAQPDTQASGLPIRSVTWGGGDRSPGRRG